MSLMENDRPAARPAAAWSLPLVMLIAANLVPLVGVFLWDWRIFDVVALYWAENVVVGGMNVLKMALCAPDPRQVPMQVKSADGAPIGSAGSQMAIHHVSKLFFIPFFVVHYGIFTFVHGLFVFSLLGGNSGIESAGPMAGMRSMIAEIVEGGGKWALLALVVSHGVSFVHHFLIGGEFRRTIAPVQMFAPYGRVVVLHVAILAGAFAISALGSPVLLLAILIAGKIGIDIGLHRRSHRRRDGGDSLSEIPMA